MRCPVRGDVEARIAELEAQRDAIDTRRPRFWTITGGVMTRVVIGVVTHVGCLGGGEPVGVADRVRSEFEGVDARVGLLRVAGTVHEPAGEVSRTAAKMAVGGVYREPVSPPNFLICGKIQRTSTDSAGLWPAFARNPE